jgi:lipopolysaccharide export system permease protein
MKKILFNKLLSDCLIFFFIALFFTSTIIWIFQAVNFLDIMIEDGRDHLVYLKFTALIFPKIISKILPFIFFLSFVYVITKYELNNELVIFWNYGVNKIKIVNYFFRFSIMLAIFQIFLNSIVVPTTQDQARSYLRTSSINFLENFIKPKKFNDTIKDLTIYADSISEDGNFSNIYIKKGSGFDDFQTTYAKKANFKNFGNRKIFELYNGETISVVKGKITNFKFSKSNFSLDNLKTNTITHRKTQEVSTVNLFLCFKNIYKEKSVDLSEELKIENCKTENIENIIKEFHKRIIVPLYIPVLMLLTLLLIIESKENINYLKFRLVIFLIGVFTIVISEMTLRFVNSSLVNNLTLLFLPISLIIILYSIFTYRYHFTNKY